MRDSGKILFGSSRLKVIAVLSFGPLSLGDGLRLRLRLRKHLLGILSGDCLSKRLFSFRARFTGSCGGLSALDGLWRFLPDHVHVSGFGLVRNVKD